MNRKFNNRPIKFVVALDGEDIFGETVTNIEIVDEAAGEFVEVSQSQEAGAQRIRLDNDEWLAVRSAIDNAFSEIKKNAKRVSKS